MLPEGDRGTCPHCGARLCALTLPDEGGWDHPYDLVCFNDDCPYFHGGWKWMFEKFGVRSSYRFRRDPKSGHASPLGVWSVTALRNRIVDDRAEQGACPCSPPESDLPRR